MTHPIFSDRTARLEDARAASQEACEREFVTTQAAAESRLTDLLAKGFAELHRRWFAATYDERYDALLAGVGMAPKEYGEDFAPYFLDILKEVEAVRAPAQAPETIELICADAPSPMLSGFVQCLLEDSRRII